MGGTRAGYRGGRGRGGVPDGGKTLEKGSPREVQEDDFRHESSTDGGNIDTANNSKTKMTTTRAVVLPKKGVVVSPKTKTKNNSIEITDHPPLAAANTHHNKTSLK